MIAVILCTYNGEKYIQQQLESLLNQTYNDVVVYIHDDGSTDSTADIIDKFVNSHPSFKCIVMNDECKHRGAGPSFMWALSNIDADYYMFCDQDDYWLPTKIERTYNGMLDIERKCLGKPVLIHTDLTLTDSQLNITHNSFWEYQNFKVDISKNKNYISFGNIVTGCTMIINKPAKAVAFPYDGEMLHDYWLALKVAKYGVIENIKEQTILYRQHGGNEAGAGVRYNRYNVNFTSFFNQLSDEFKRFKTVSGLGFFSWLYFRTRYFYYRHFSC